MLAYPQLRDLDLLTPHDISQLARALHSHYRITREKETSLQYLKMLIEDFQSDKVVGHPFASVHVLSCLREMEEYDVGNKFWQWLEKQDTNFTDGRTYGAAIELLSVQGAPLEMCETLYTAALELHSGSTTASIAATTGRTIRLILLQGIITARLHHGAWRPAYEAFDLCVRLYPTLTPARIYELFIYERPISEAYIVFLMACRAGSPPASRVLTHMLDTTWTRTNDVRAMMKLCYGYVGAGGRPRVEHLNMLVAGLLGSLRNSPENKTLFDQTMSLVRSLIAAFSRVGVRRTVATFNTIISLGGKMRRIDLVESGLREILNEKMSPTMVTYRALLMAFGQIKDERSVESAWKSLAEARKEMKVPWNLKDLKALARACKFTGKEGFARNIFEEIKLDIGYTMYREAIEALIQPIRPEPGQEVEKTDPGKASTNAKDAETADLDATISENGPSPSSSELETAGVSASPDSPATAFTATSTTTDTASSPPTDTVLPTHPPSLSAQAAAAAHTDTETELARLTSIFTSRQTSDFSSSPALGEPLFTLGGGSGTGGTIHTATTPPSAPKLLQPLLEELYQRLQQPSQSTVPGGEEGTSRTSTGFDVARLRFENWKSVNRLLFEAECTERDRERVAVRRLMAKKQQQQQGGDGGSDGAGAGDKFVIPSGVEEFLERPPHLDEQDAKAEVERVLAMRERGDQDWRRKEMAMRGKLV